jgi:predicted dehydrogenase
MISCALIGKGYWGSILKRYIEESNFFSLVAVCDSKSDLNEIWNDRSIEAVIVATPIETHYGIVRAALLSGKHVFSEKPLALKASQCRALKRIADKNGLVLHTDYVFTFSDSLEAVRKLVGREDVGRLLALEMNVKHLGRFGRQDVYWLLASHMLSVLGMFVPLDGLRFCFFDLVKDETGVILFNGDVKGAVNVSLNCPCKLVEIVFYCEKATLTYNPDDKVSLAVVFYEKPEWVIGNKIPKHTDNICFDEGNNLRFAFRSFADCIEGKERHNVDLAVKITEVMEKR